MDSTKRKNALIITFYKASNYGAFLQAFALQTFLQQIGIDASIYEWEIKQSYIQQIQRKVVVFIKKLKKGCRDKDVSGDEYIYRDKMREVVQDGKDCYLKLSKKYDGFYLTVLGSDEIWNLRNMGSSHDAFFFSRNRNSVKTISYAPSVGKTTTKEFAIFRYAVNGIRGLDAVSVRDDKSENTLRHFGIKGYARVLDPTFLIDYTPYLPVVSTKQPYLLVYSYGLTNNEVEELKSYAKKHSLSLFMTGAYFDCSELDHIPTPFEWLSLISNAAGIVTSTFHGTVFSIIFRKNFAVYHQTPKVQSLLDEFNLSQRIVKEGSCLEKIMDKEIEYASLENLINDKIHNSQKYLIDNV